MEGKVKIEQATKAVVSLVKPIEVHPWCAADLKRVKKDVFEGRVVLHQVGGLGLDTEEFGELHFPSTNIAGVQRSVYRPAERRK